MRIEAAQVEGLRVAPWHCSGSCDGLAAAKTDRENGDRDSSLVYAVLIPGRQHGLVAAGVIEDLVGADEV